jgi:nucleotide-binding universal stress UspA family protein
MFETILAPLDGSKLAEQAIPYITRLAQQFNSEVILMGVCDSEETPEGETCRLSINNQAESLKIATLPAQVTFKPVVVTGNAAQQIIDYAEENNIGLLILTSHGHSGLAPWSVGSTVQKILHLNSTIPLLLVKAKETPEKQDDIFGHILLPLDKSQLGEAAVPYIIDLTKKFESEVTLLHVIEEGKHIHTIGGLNYIRFLDQDLIRAKIESEKYLEEVAFRFLGTKARIVNEVRIGEPAREILKFVSQQEQYLIAIASHGHSGISAWSLGSVAYKISQSVNQPLLLIKIRTTI